MNKLKVRDIMSRDPVVIDKDATIHDAIEKMLGHEIHGLIAMDNDEAVGVVTINDALALMEKGESGTDTLVCEFMSKGIISIGPEEDLQNSLRMMISNDIHRLPVIKDEKLIGIITSSDLMRVFQGIYMRK
jgi:CBS domain-containing protein